MNILIADDEKLIRNVLKEYLLVENYHVFEANDGKEVLDIIRNNCIDLILLDIMMPELSGIEVCTKIRDKVNCPIIFLSAKTELIDKMLGYEIGGDDYITKPFNNSELVLKIKSHLRLNKRVNNLNKNNIIKIGEILINKETFEVYKEDEKIELSTREFELLKYLMENAGIVLSKEQIFESVWGSNYGDIGTVAVNIKSLRDKLKDKNKYIITIWGYGYKFVRNVENEK